MAGIKIGSGAVTRVYLGSTRVAGWIKPTEVSGLAGWWDASALGLSDGDAVASWSDLSGNSRTLAQGTSGARPAYRATGLNGKPAVDFDGSDDYLEVDSTSALDLTGNFLVLAVFQLDVVTLGNGSYANTICGKDYSRWEFAETLGKLQGRVGGIGGALESAGIVSTDRPYLAAFQKQPTNTVSLRFGNNLLLSGTNSNTNSETYKFRVGGRASGGSTLFLNGKLSELLVYSSDVANASRAALAAYLTEKWL